MKCRKVLIDAEGLGKDLESRMLSRGPCRWASPLGNNLACLGQGGKPSGAADGEGWKRRGSRQWRKLKAASSTIFAQDFGSISGCKFKCLDRHLNTVFDGARLASREQMWNVYAPSTEAPLLDP